MPNLQWEHTDTESYSYADLNRIETAIQELQELLSGYGYTISNPCKTDWTRDDLPAQSEIDRIRSNIKALQDVYCHLPDWHAVVSGNKINAKQVNAWEWDLHIIGIWLDRMASITLHSAQPMMHSGYIWYPAGTSI